MSSSNKLKVYNKGFIDGCFDGFHYGHVNALFQSKNVCNILLAGSHNDSEIKLVKQRPCLFNYNDRSELLKYCRFIDEYVGEVPYNTNIDVLNNFECEMFFHGDDNIDKYPLIELNNDNKLHVYNRTKGISTSDILKRIDNYKKGIPVKTNMDLIYLKHIFNQIEESLPKQKFDNIVVIKCCWDLFNIHHLELLKDIKNKYPNHGIYIDLITEDKYDIFNKYEMAIVLLGIKLVDKVLLYDSNLIDSTNGNIILIGGSGDGSNIDNSFNDRIAYIERFKYVFIKHLDISLNDSIDKEQMLQVYKILLENNFNNIMYLLKSTTFTENDMIIFDIDEVCLCNLMNYGLDVKEFGNDKYNVFNGMIPLNIQCKQLFEFMHSNNIKYSFITSRRDFMRELTIKNLELENIDNYSYLFTCPDNYVGKISDFKETCRKTLVDEGWNIVFTIGDQVSDISGKYTGIPFLIYNPFYKTN